MSLVEFEKVSVNKFYGLYLRGLTDACPPDHSTIAQNLRFNRQGECFTRDGFKPSLGTAAPIRRMFLATFGHTDQTGIVLTCDGAGNIYRSDTGGILLSVPGMVDFAAINIFSWCLISPILSAPTLPNPVYIWSGLPASGGSGDTVPIRPAAGVGPLNTIPRTFLASESSTAGDCDIGIHKFGVSYITNTGYTTQPGPTGSIAAGGIGDEKFFEPATVTSTGGKCITLSGIPIGGPEVVARQILATQANQDLYFNAGGRIFDGTSLVPWDGIIHDNTTTSITISFFDTDLAVSADRLFDLLPIIPAGTFGLIAGITTYHGRVLYWGGEFNLIRVTDPGSAEAIDNVNGFIQLPEQNDGNDVTNASNLQDTLYFFKLVGIFSVTDNGGDPNTWSIITIEQGVGCAVALSLGTVSLATPAFAQNQINLVTDLGGIYLFNGAIIQPPLTWKINDLWLSIMEQTNLQGSMIAVDPYFKLIYYACVGNALGTPGWGNLLVADYNDGLDAQNIKWSIWTFPFPITAIGMMSFTDVDGLSNRFRVGSGNNIVKYEVGALTDLGGPIVTVWRSYYLAPSLGALNIFRYLRARLPYKDPISITLFSEDDAFTKSPPGFALPYTPGRDLTREFNFMDEKMSIQLCCNATHGGFILQRLDAFCKERYAMRPAV